MSSDMMSIAAARLNEIKTQQKTVFSQADQKFSEVYNDIIGKGSASDITVVEASGSSASSSAGLTETSALGSLLSSGLSSDGGDMSSLMGAMMLSSMGSSSLLGSSGSSGTDMSSMLMMYMLMNQMQNMGTSSSSEHLCSTCQSVIDSYTSSNAGAFTGAEQYMSIVNACAEKYDVPTNIILGVMKVESGFQNGLTSSAGAQGLMQLMPRTAESLGVTDVMDPAQNIEGGTKYIRQMLDMFDGDIRLALAAYNTGPGNVKEHGGTFEGQTAGVQGYVNKVLGYAGVSAA